jgi:hypothetical protein
VCENNHKTARPEPFRRPPASLQAELEYLMFLSSGEVMAIIVKEVVLIGQLLATLDPHLCLRSNSLSSLPACSNQN